MRRSFSRRTQGATAWAAVDQKYDGWEAVTPWVFALTLLLVVDDHSGVPTVSLTNTFC